MPATFLVQKAVANDGSFDVNPTPMRRSLLAMFILAAAACVDVPDSVRAQFAGPGAADRSNYRPGQHGSAPPVEDPPVAKAAGAAAPSATGDASSSAASSPDHDGGAPAQESAAPVAVDGGAS